MTTEPVDGRECSSLGTNGLSLVAYPNRDARLGDLPISRALPIRDRRMVGPWCFLDCFGPLAFSGAPPLHVPPHPHIGIQTVSWLLAGEVLHHDSLGSTATVRPGGVNVMTSGSGIAHAEKSPAQNSGELHGVQLWVALPEAERNRAPAFMHVPRVPRVAVPGGAVQVFAGSYGGQACPAAYFSKIVGLEVQVNPGEALELELNPEFEHAALLLSGGGRLVDQPLAERMLYYLGSQRSGVALSSRTGSRVLMLGGPPFPEKILMWWNFVARAPEEIAQARADWEAQRRFGEVPGEHGPRLAAPDLVRFARPNPAS